MQRRAVARTLADVPAGQVPPSAVELLERGPFLTELGGLIDAAAAGDGRLILVGGEAGVGKSALMRAFAGQVAARARVLVGNCDPLSTPRPLGPLLDVAEAVGGGVARLPGAGGERHGVFAALLSAALDAPCRAGRGQRRAPTRPG